MESNENIISAIKGIVLCFCNLKSIKDYFDGQLIQNLYDNCKGSDQMALTCDIKELIDCLKEPLLLGES